MDYYNFHLDEKLEQHFYQEKLKEAFTKANTEGFSISFPDERELDYNLVNKYKNTLHRKYQDFFNDVIDNTVYISDFELDYKLKRSFEKFSHNIKNIPFYVFLNRMKFASMGLMTVRLMHLINDLNFIGFVSSNSLVENGTNVVVIDDASYSGNNLEAIIDELSYANIGKVINFHLVVPFISTFMYNYYTKLEHKSNSIVQLQTQIYNVYPYSINTFRTINEILEEKGLEKYQHDIFEYFNLEGELNLQIPIYFDHAVAANTSTFKSIYLKEIKGKILINYSPDLNVRNRVYDKFFKDLLPTPFNY